MASTYAREKALKERGVTIRRANHFEQTTNEYGDKLIWVIDRGEFQALRVFKTKGEAIAAAEQYETE
jgi:hypothetical protein